MNDPTSWTDVLDENEKDVLGSAVAVNGNQMRNRQPQRQSPRAPLHLRTSSSDSNPPHHRSDRSTRLTNGRSPQDTGLIQKTHKNPENSVETATKKIKRIPESATNVNPVYRGVRMRNWGQMGV
ncbi:Uncharacterized protein Fot_08923 [Forsythia ovata]|uniref:Uncharacterized protein n=1 Tax=Forsythia ovata TaxID=205694 RepID=A0ABD1WCJ5_9LAMI